MTNLEIQMQARGCDEDGPAISVVSGIHDVLRVARHEDASGEMGRVVTFEDRFAPIPQGAVAEYFRKLSKGK